MRALWHLTVNSVWKWSGLRAWDRKIRTMLQNAHGGRVLPRDHGDDIPIVRPEGSRAQLLMEEGRLVIRVYDKHGREVPMKGDE